MVVSVSNQMMVFLAACLTGALLGATYDLFRIFRLVIRCGRVAVFFQDILFLLICAAATYLFFILKSAGAIRFYIIEGELIGAVLYYLTVGKLVMRAARAVIKGMQKAGGAVRGYVLPRARRAGAKFRRHIHDKGKRAKSLLIKEHKLLRNCLKPSRKVLYNLINASKGKRKKAGKKQAVTQNEKKT